VPVPELSRRIFLKRSMQSLGALAALPLLPSGCAPGTPIPSALRTLTPRQYAILDAVADALLPAGGAFGPGARELGLAERLDAVLFDEDPDVVSALRGALWFVELAAPPLSGRLGVFSHQGAEARTAALGGLSRSFGLARDVFGALKQLCCFHFYCIDAAWEHVGYDGPWVGREVAGGRT
jgi:hypothetical protein